MATDEEIARKLQEEVIIFLSDNKISIVNCALDSLIEKTKLH